MTTIKLRVSDKIVDNVMWLLGQFKSDDLEVITTDSTFVANQNYLRNELELVESGKSKSISIDKLDEILEKAIQEYED